jgi:hypothetical protein
LNRITTTNENRKAGIKMIRFADFVPRELEKAGFFKRSVREQLSDCLQRANSWIAENHIRILNIETVVLPNISHPGEEGSIDTELYTSGEMSSQWYQFIRVWYQQE